MLLSVLMSQYNSIQFSFNSNNNNNSNICNTYEWISIKFGIEDLWLYNICLYRVYAVITGNAQTVIRTYCWKQFWCDVMIIRRNTRKKNSVLVGCLHCGELCSSTFVHAVRYSQGHRGVQ
jgi:hypothetical protein